MREMITGNENPKPMLMYLLILIPLLIATKADEVSIGPGNYSAIARNGGTQLITCDFVDQYRLRSQGQNIPYYDGCYEIGDSVYFKCLCYESDSFYFILENKGTIIVNVTYSVTSRPMPMSPTLVIIIGVTVPKGQVVVTILVGATILISKKCCDTRQKEERRPLVV